jgi:ABC-type sugar transport system ATPase subunit
MTAPAVRFDGITKRFPGVVALDDVSFDVTAGSCHAICGENGAGKSTLGKILSGLIAPDEGRILLHGDPVRFAGPRDALQAGVVMVHQELALCENMSVAENLCLGALPARHTFVSRRALRARARELLAAVGATTDPSTRVADLTVAEQQRVQIASAVGSGARVIVFDEPTSSLAEADALRLFELIGQLRARGVTILYVSHRMHEIFRLCDTVTVLRDGRHVATQPTASVTEAALVQLMIGRKLDQYFPDHVRREPGPELLRVERLSHPGRFEDVSFHIRAGEVVGLAGLVGAGRSEVAQALFGLDPDATGRVFVDGQPVAVRSPRHAMRLGLGFVPEDRKRQGLVLSLVCRENTTLPTLERISRYSWVRREREREVTLEYFSRLGVRANLVDAGTASLSGGNQQKLVLAKWLAANSRVLILDEPTRGVDVGTKAELHAWIDRLASSGVGIVLISSELPELLNLSSRILVLRAGRLMGEVPRDRADQDLLLRMMTGLDNSEAVA